MTIKHSLLIELTYYPDRITAIATVKEPDDKTTAVVQRDYMSASNYSHLDIYRDIACYAESAAAANEFGL